MFLGLTNSCDDIIRDRIVLQRERNLNVRLPYYIFAKTVTLALFAAIQCALFVLIGSAILEIRGMFWPHFFFNFITALCGIAFGLFISSVVQDGKIAANIVPLILIPNIILGGALIKYEDMNRDLDFIHTVQEFFTNNPHVTQDPEDAEVQVPLICELIPMRWSYEALVVAQDKLNPLTKRQDEIQAQIDKLVQIDQRTDAQDARLDDLKDALAYLSGLESVTVDDVEDRIRKIDKIIHGAALDPAGVRSRHGHFTAERLYVNDKISDLVSKAETDQADYRNSEPVNVFFGPVKNVGSYQVSVLLFNTAVLIGFTGICLGLVHISLKRQLSTKA
jgi:hypothetical protein